MSHVPSTDICIVHVLSQWMWHFHSPPSQDIVPRTTLGQVLQANKFPDPGRITKITDHADSSRTQLHDKNLILQPSAVNSLFQLRQVKNIISTHVTLKTKCRFLKAEMSKEERGSFLVAVHKMSSALRRESRLNPRQFASERVASCVAVQH